RLSGLAPSGLRSSLADGWTTLELTLTNPAPNARDARVLVFFSGRPDVQYGRDIWVPGRASLAAWMLLGPAPAGPDATRSQDLQILLYDRTGGREQLLLPPGRERIRSRTLPFQRREPVTSVLLDLPPDGPKSDTSAP